MKKSNTGRAKSVTLDFSWHEFMQMTEWQCEKNNKHFIKVAKNFPSSKRCSKCGEKKGQDELPLSVRIYKCEHCGYEIDRDLNASANLKEEGIRILREQGVCVEY